MRGANYSGNCSGFDQLLIRSFQINARSRICGACAGLFASAHPVGADLSAMRPSNKARTLRRALVWCSTLNFCLLRVHARSFQGWQMPTNAPFYPALAIFGHWHAICSLVRQVRLADYPRPATPFFQGSGPPRSRPSGGQHVEVGSTHQRS